MSPARIRATIGVVVGAIAVLACSDQTTAPDSRRPAPLSVVPITGPLSSPQWHARTRSLVAQANQNAIAATRTYAAVAIAQYRAVLAVDKQLDTEGEQPESGLGAGGRSRYEAHRGAVA